MTTPLAFRREFLPKGSFSFIVHLFDRLLVGISHPGQEDGRLLRALERDEVLEGHFFDGSMEIYVSRVNGELTAYEPIVVKEPGNGEYDVIERSYELEEAPYNMAGEGKSKYNRLVVRERIAYEDDLAYVKYAMLCRLERGDVG